MDYFDQAMGLFSKGVFASGSLLTVWGIIQLGAAIKEHNGPGMQNSIFQIVGGAVIIAAGAWIATISI
ncbi:hypothetical protein BH747_06020 [Enterococcus villorum]|jgi:hypothetical protein|uniref:Uncharacterized protein n=2 Tax=Enterococcus villorum TaxID=112904 RepID=A0A1V8YD65_9ENTE|nr:hypothetical protein [Enterococcus villorum]EOH88724.1 hypothetical protein UAO_01828 [Enterococcus villorum ATCC 700913]EOW76361.1 hypothetical protein I591_01664 [Enterococcus villorum ATCC 700913]OQO70577.1 hypothetical protein BH747_06020 [Enterococcus villorum]OQO73804.1 hypothetical protein BH744_08530 [Enterococcus villorum]GEL92589.1 hypothetical protein EVI01_19260 [Enterococcus villorum]